MARPRIGLALGSGVARGWAHIGVLRALERAGMKPDIICGTSIGALVGGVYLADHLATLEEWALSLNRMRLARYLDVQFGGGGLIAGRRLTALLRENLGDRTIESLPRPLVCVACELATGHEVWVQRGPLVEAIRASYALPGVFSPVGIESRWLVDGALVNPVPVSVCRALGARLVIAVNLNADVFGKSRVEGHRAGASSELELVEEPAGGLEALSARPASVMMRQLFGHEKNAPSMFSVMVGSLNIIQDRLSRSRLAGDPPDVIVAPRLGHIGLLEFHRAAEAIEEGEAAVARSLPFLREALSVLSS
jgi:NTE family protein